MTLHNIYIHIPSKYPQLMVGFEHLVFFRPWRTVLLFWLLICPYHGCFHLIYFFNTVGYINVVELYQVLHVPHIGGCIWLCPKFGYLKTGLSYLIITFSLSKQPCAPDTDGWVYNMQYNSTMSVFIGKVMIHWSHGSRAAIGVPPPRQFLQHGAPPRLLWPWCHWMKSRNAQRINLR